MRHAPSRMEYSEWTWRWTKGASGTGDRSYSGARKAPAHASIHLQFPFAHAVRPCSAALSFGVSSAFAAAAIVLSSAAVDGDAMHARILTLAASRVQRNCE
jgi:hypothetical protein